ncbi:MAG: hypothetical protein HC785_32010 [Calothrix sp. CSU_2_0]|nr:hypothetical protein [Calothrix sp. CSU_2_0]
MTSSVLKGSLDFLSEKHKAELSNYLKAWTTVMPHQLAVWLGIEYSEAIAVLSVLEAQGLCEMKLLIYHNCEPEVPVGAIPFGKGFPDLPWICPNCQQNIDNYDELSFDSMAIFKQQIEFV